MLLASSNQGGIMGNLDNNKFYEELIKSVIAQNKKQVKDMKIICVTCIIATTVIISSLVGGALYFLSTYSVDVTDTITYEQSSDGNSNIINGNQYKDNAIHNALTEKEAR